MITREAEGCSKLFGFFVECGNAVSVDGWMQRMCLLCAPSGVERPNVEFLCCERSDHKWVDGRVSQPDSRVSEMFLSSVDSRKELMFGHWTCVFWLVDAMDS